MQNLYDDEPPKQEKKVENPKKDEIKADSMGHIIQYPDVVWLRLINNSYNFINQIFLLEFEFFCSSGNFYDFPLKADW